MKNHSLVRALVIAAAAATSPVLAADIVLTPPAGGGVAVTNATGGITRLRIADDGATLDGNLVLPAASSASAGTIFKGVFRFIHNFGTYNTFIGENAGNFTMTGGYNAASGYQALFSNTTGSGNTANGEGALYSNTTGYGNAASGNRALYRNTTGVGNTANGGGALNFNTAGDFNIAVGPNALNSNTTGSGNIAIGYLAGSNLDFGNDNIAIGNGGVAADAGTIRIGSSASHSRTFIAGIRGTTTGSVGAVAVVIDPYGQLGTVSSSRRFKDDIADMDSASSALMKLRPVTFHYRSDHAAASRPLQYGLVAEEVAEVYPGLVARSADGQVETVMYQFLPSMLLNEYQKQQRTIEVQARHLARLEQDRDVQAAKFAARIETQASFLSRQTERLAQLERDRQIQAAELADLKQGTARMAKLLGRLEREGLINTAGR